ncbi:FkbM family methyltransferase [Gemmatimonadota bacterium]
MSIGGRSISRFFGALFQRRHYRAAWNMLRLLEHPLDGFRRYLFRLGDYPTRVALRTPSGPIGLTLHSPHDILTLNEVFCRVDYPTGGRDRVVVDWGSNIGISAAYFLTQESDSFVHCFEPLPMNLSRMEENLEPWAGRFQVHPVAVAPQGGSGEFGHEPTGRYGGLGLHLEGAMAVECVGASDALEGILRAHEAIDILKIDIESLELDVLESIPEDVLRRIRKIYVEYRFRENPLETTHHWTQYGWVGQFSLR